MPDLHDMVRRVFERGIAGRTRPNGA